jgi:hypothetical protein
MSEAAAHVPVDVSKAQGNQWHFEIASAVATSPLGRFVAEKIVSNIKRDGG